MVSLQGRNKRDAENSRGEVRADKAQIRVQSAQSDPESESGSGEGAEKIERGDDPFVFSKRTDRARELCGHAPRRVSQREKRLLSFEREATRGTEREKRLLSFERRGSLSLSQSVSEARELGKARETRPRGNTLKTPSQKGHVFESATRRRSLSRGGYLFESLQSL